MIPKVINYIWVGSNELPSYTKMVINNWKRKLPDYEIIQWDESNLPIEQLKKENIFFKKCCEYKLYAFMSDYLRLWVLYNHGGIYLDTDVEVLKKFDPLLKNKGFMGFETGDAKIGEYIGSGIIGAEKGNPTLKKILAFYQNDIWNTSEYINTRIYKKLYLKNKDIFRSMKIYPKNFFAPYSPYDRTVIDNKHVIGDEESYTIHWFNANWNISRQGYVFITTKHIKNPILKVLIKIKRWLGYKK